MSTDLKLSKAQISKIIQSGRFLGSLLSKLAGPLIKVAIPLAKNVLAPLGITAAVQQLMPKINLPKKIKDGTYVINLDEYADVGTHWIALFCNKNEIVWFVSFGVEHVPEEIKKFVGNKNIIANIFWVQANDSVMCGYFCIGFINFMLAGKNLTYYTGFFSPHDFKKKDDIKKM